MANAATQRVPFADQDMGLNADRISWDFGASAEEYRKLIHYLPVALWQVDMRGASAAFDRLKAEGVSDIAAYLDTHPELVEHAKDVIQVTAVNREAVSLLCGT